MIRLLLSTILRHDKIGRIIKFGSKQIGEIEARWRWLFWETLIIVLGVLIAFAVNDYWSERQDRELELQYLKRLYADLKSDEEWVSNFIENGIPRKMAALDAIAPVVHGREPVPGDTQEFLKNVMLGAIGGASPNYFVTSTTFEDLKATGNLRLIRDTGFRSAINEYYVNFNNDHKRVLSRTTGFFMFVHGILPSELRDGIDMQAIQAFGVEEAYEKILSQEFRELLNQEYNFGYFLQRTYAQFASSADELSQQVAAQIRQLESP
jgi:hypothetical protein